MIKNIDQKCCSSPSVLEWFGTAKQGWQCLHCGKTYTENRT